VPEPPIRWSTYPNGYARPLAGRLERHTFTSDLLAGNPLGDPAERPVEVYVPPGYDDDGDRRYPSIYVIQGYTGTVAMGTTARRSGRPSPKPPTRCSPAARRRRAFLSSWTRGPRTGAASSSTPPARGRTTPTSATRSCSHAGDALYELCYVPSFGKVVRALRAYDGSYERFWEDFAARAPMSKETDGDLVMTYGVAAAFSADDDGTVHLPFDLRTGRLVDDVWARWLAWDPVRMVPRHADALRGLGAIYLDGGTKDEWYLELGALAFRDALAEIGVTDVACELFEAGHGGIDYRYPRGLAYLADRLAPADQ
jgi:hypothetical protein